MNHGKTQLKTLKDELGVAFRQGVDIALITRQLCSSIDALLVTLFESKNLHRNPGICLLALGGYGRCELQLHSDIDLLLLHDASLSEDAWQEAQAFIQDGWDSGFEIGHQITTVEACAALAGKDISVLSSLLDARLLSGNQHLLDELRQQTGTSHMWSSADFFLAKHQEQQQRYLKYGETAYNLEPNIKLGVGGLRDLHILLAIGKRHFGIQNLADGVACHFITDKEYDELLHCQQFLWRVRFALHLLSGKREDRLLFDYQVPLAALFGFVDTPQSLAIEQFMKACFKVIKQSRELNELLLQWFSETMINPHEININKLDDTFQLIDQSIDVTAENVFQQQPEALLRLFVWMAKCPSITGIRARTIRLLRQHLYQAGNALAASMAQSDLFLALFRDVEDPYNALQHMNKYGVLGHYLDCFAAVTGQMQYDLFHVFTVDQHTLFVIRNLVRFLNPEYRKQFPLAAEVMAGLEKRDVLYLAALFHDIAKGRGGDHSELGAVEAQAFAERHHLSDEDRNLLVWLVRQHLLMSKTAQREDIYDPKIINRFCDLLPDPVYLDCLYLLTVADICATNPGLWNSWKDSLLKELYRATRHAQQEKQTRLDEHALIRLRQEAALSLLIADGCDAREVNTLWQGIKSKYFLHESADVIACHTKAILACEQFPLVLILPHHSQGGTEVLIYMPHRVDRFTIATTVLSNQHVTIQEATILTCDNHFDIDTYIILDERNQDLIDEHRANAIKQALVKQLAKVKEWPSISRQRMTRTQAHFNVKPDIAFVDDDESGSSCLLLIAADKPGLLARVSRVFSAQGVHLHSAKIATAGERAEDTFYLSSQTGQALTPDEKEQLRVALLQDLT